MTTNNIYRDLLYLLDKSGDTVSPRQQEVRELLCVQSRIGMKNPVVTIPERRLNYAFMAAEAHWILSGSSRLDRLTPHCAKMAEFSDDGLHLSGAYGPRFISQVRYVVDALVADTDTRQAVMTIWERSPRPSKDIPCTVSLQWLIRRGELHCVVYMRSSDAWLGWPYDVFSFTMMTCYVLLSLPPANRVPLGELRLIAGSQHLYERDFNKVENLFMGCSESVDFSPITLHGLITPDDLLNGLSCAKECPNDKVVPKLEEYLCQ